MIQTLATVACVLLAVPGLLTVAHLGLLAIGSLFYQERTPTGEVPTVRFLVVVPAHNEALVLDDTLSALTADLRPTDALLVVDDRSTDRTAAIAESYGAEVLRRPPEAEPGRAAARQAAIDAAASMEWDAMVMIDADSIIEPGFFDAAERMMATGAVAIQARSEAALGHRLVDQAALASFALQGVLMPRGRDRLGFLVRLRGTGMVCTDPWSSASPSGRRRPKIWSTPSTCAEPRSPSAISSRPVSVPRTPAPGRRPPPRSSATRLAGSRRGGSM